MSKNECEGEGSGGGGGEGGSDGGGGIMELIQTQDHFVLQHLLKGSKGSLWACRKSGRLSIRESWELANEENPECLGLVYGIVGKVRLHQDLAERLVLIRDVERCGSLPGGGGDEGPHSVFKIRAVALVPLVPHSPPGVSLRPCPKHPPQGTQYDSDNESGSQTSRLKKFGGPLKLLATDSIKSAGSAASALALSQVAKLNNGGGNNGSSVPNKTLERYEKRLLEEFLKLFNDSDSFYYSLSGDLSNSLQRQSELSESNKEKPLWQCCDDRFFFNKNMLLELIELKDSRVDSWIIPIIQGYVEFVKCPQEYTDPELLNLPSFYEIALISRRSRHRAGTRYKRRGVNEDGNVANYVETEQILIYHKYALSFVMVRGSIPVYWSQPGYRYRPPPVLDRSKEEDIEAFTKHFNNQFQTYGPPIVAINLAEKTGREKVISDAYFENSLTFDDKRLLFVCFDFHEYCRGMHFENVDVLVKCLELSIRSMRYCWFDSHGMVCGQRGVFRVNCVDCLDRTNVVQTAIARTVLEIQLTKLGLVPPEKNLEDCARLSFQGVWANNGDVISRQYAGTNALKGDFTRTGERNFSGLMKDGVNSANRYYLNQFRDSLRQTIIDCITGGVIDDDVANIEDDGKLSVSKEEEEQQVKNIIEDCKKLLIPNVEDVIGAWGLIDNDPINGDPQQEDLDTILILVRDSYYVALYDDGTEKVTDFQKVKMNDIEKIEFGLPEKDTFNLGSFRNKKRDEHCIRIHYRMKKESGEDDFGYFHSFRSTNLRFFNNVPVTVTSEEERIESLKSIVDTFGITYELATNSAPVVVFGKIEKKKSKCPSDFRSASTTRISLRNVGNRAIMNMSSRIAKLNPMKLRGNKPEEDLEEPKKVSSEFLALHSRIGENVIGNESDPSIFSEFLSPLDAGMRQLSRSSDNIQRFFEVDKDSNPKRTSSHKDLPLGEEALGMFQEAATPVVLSPLAKLTKGLQNIGASLGRSERKIDSTDLSSSQDDEPSDDKLQENEVQDYMKSRLKETSSNTQFIIL